MAVNDIPLLWYAAPLDPERKGTLAQFFARWAGAAWAAVFTLSGTGSLTLSDSVHLYLSAQEGSTALVDLTCTLATTVITATESGADTQSIEGTVQFLLWNDTIKKELAWGTAYFHPNTKYVAGALPTSIVGIPKGTGTGFITATPNVDYALPLIATALKTADYTAAAQNLVPCDATAGSFTVTLKATPAVGDRIGVKMMATGSAHTVTIARNGSTIDNVAGNLQIAAVGDYIELVCVGSNSWAIVNRTLTGTGYFPVLFF